MEEKEKFFLSVGVRVVKLDFRAVPAQRRNPASATVPTALELPPPSIPDRATMLPKQAHYQLRNTPL